MKTIRLTINSIFHFFRCEITSSIMIIFSLIFIYFSQFTFIGVLNHLNALRHASSSYTSICITPLDESISEYALAFFESEPLGKMNNAFVVDLHMSEDRPQMVGWKGTAFTRWQALEAGTSFFTDEQVESSERIAMMSVTSLGKRPKMRTVNGKEYSVIEYGSFDVYMLLRRFPTKFDYYEEEFGYEDLLFIPYHTFFADGFIPEAIVLDFKEALTGSESKTIRLLEKYFPNCQIHLVGSSKQTQAREGEYDRILAMFIGVACLSALSVFTFFNGWIRQNSRQYKLYILCGATHAKVFLLLLLEWGFLTLLAGGIAYAALILATPLLNSIGISISITPVHFICVTAVGLLFSYISSLRTIFTICNTGYRQGE